MNGARSMSCKSITRVLHKSVLQNCAINVLQDSARMFSNRGQECVVRAYKSVLPCHSPWFPVRQNIHRQQIQVKIKGASHCKPSCHRISPLFPECVARVPVSLWGCGGRAVFPRRCVYLRNRSQSFATVRVRAVAYRKLCGRGHFWSFPASRSFISRGSRGTSWHSNMFHDVSKVVLCGRRNTFATFSEDALFF